MLDPTKERGGNSSFRKTEKKWKNSIFYWISGRKSRKKLKKLGKFLNLHPPPQKKNEGNFLGVWVKWSSIIFEILKSPPHPLNKCPSDPPLHNENTRNIFGFQEKGRARPIWTIFAKRVPILQTAPLQNLESWSFIVSTN